MTFSSFPILVYLKKIIAHLVLLDVILSEKQIVLHRFDEFI